MEKISPETKAIYDLLWADFDAALSRTTAERSEELSTVFAKLDSKLDLLSGRIDDVKLSIGVDLDELRGEIGADRGAASSPTAPPPPRATAARSGSSGSEGTRSEAEQRNSGPRYVPPPARGMVVDPVPSTCQIVPVSEGFRQYQADAVSFGP